MENINIELINELAMDMDREVSIPENEEEQDRLVKELLNIRLPKKPSEKLLNLETKYLKNKLLEKEIIDVNDLKETSLDSRISLFKGDITTLKADAIVNAANKKLLGCFAPEHLCIDNVIHTAAGMMMRYDCNQIMQGGEEETGKAKITSGYMLPAKYVIHTVGPIVYEELTDEHKKLLADSYNSCMALTDEKGLKSIVFCCISTGVFRFPQEEAAEIAVKTVMDYLNEKNKNIERVVFDVFTETDFNIYRRITS